MVGFGDLVLVIVGSGGINFRWWVLKEILRKFMIKYDLNFMCVICWMCSSILGVLGNFWDLRC